MNKESSIEYLNKIKPFINLSAICENYNLNNSKNQIDYNNLRVVLNGQSYTRLSEDKLSAFVMYVRNKLFVDVFEMKQPVTSYSQEKVCNIITQYSQKMISEILEEPNDDF